MVLASSPQIRTLYLFMTTLSNLEVDSSLTLCRYDVRDEASNGKNENNKSELDYDTGKTNRR